MGCSGGVGTGIHCCLMADERPAEGGIAVSVGDSLMQRTCLMADERPAEGGLHVGGWCDVNALSWGASGKGWSPGATLCATCLRGHMVVCRGISRWLGTISIPFHSSAGETTVLTTDETKGLSHRPFSYIKTSGET